MKVEPGVYPLNGADENSVCLTTVDFALTYFLVSGELERSGVPVNLIINDAGGLSVLTSWAAGKFSSSSIAKFFQEQDIEGKIKSRKLIIPGKVAVLKGELEAKMPGWEIIIAPNEAVQLVKFMKDFALTLTYIKQKENKIMGKFVTIGERLSTTAPAVNKAFLERDPEPILKRAKAAAGCRSYISGCKHRTGRRIWRGSDEMGS